MYILSNILVQIVGIAVAISVHEFGHAYSAHLLGDDTAKMYGRMTLNPAKHLDIMGLIAMLIVHIGWAKPVPVNPNNFKNYKVGNVIVSLAGVTANIIISIICVIIKKHVNMYAITEITSAIIIYNVSKVGKFTPRSILERLCILIPILSASSCCFIPLCFLMVCMFSPKKLIFFS